MFKRIAEGFGIFVLVVAAFLYIWTEQIPDVSHLQHGSHKIEIDSTAGAVDVVGEPRGDVAVKVDGSDPAARGVGVKIEQVDAATRVYVQHIPQGSRVEIHVPDDSSVGVDMTAGQLRISGIRGDIASLLRSGQMIISIDDPNRFQRADGSVFAGGINAAPFRRHKGGLLRRFVWSGSGKNNLYAHVSTGELLVR